MATSPNSFTQFSFKGPPIPPKKHLTRPSAQSMRLWYSSNEYVIYLLCRRTNIWCRCLPPASWVATCEAAATRTGLGRPVGSGAWGFVWPRRWHRWGPEFSFETVSSASPLRTATARLCRTRGSASIWTALCVSFATPACHKGQSKNKFSC